MREKTDDDYSVRVHHTVFGYGSIAVCTMWSIICAVEFAVTAIDYPYSGPANSELDVLHWGTFTAAIIITAIVFIVSIIFYKKLPAMMLGISITLMINPVILFTWGVMGSSSTPTGIFPVCIFCYSSISVIAAIVILNAQWNNSKYRAVSK